MSRTCTFEIQRRQHFFFSLYPSITLKAKYTFQFIAHIQNALNTFHYLLSSVTHVFPKINFIREIPPK